MMTSKEEKEPHCNERSPKANSKSHPNSNPRLVYQLNTEAACSGEKSLLFFNTLLGNGDIFLHCNFLTKLSLCFSNLFILRRFD